MAVLTVEVQAATTPSPGPTIVSPGYSTSTGLTTSKLAGRDETVLPSLCYESCNNPYVEIQTVGNDPSICEPGSLVRDSIELCRSCISLSSDDRDFAPYIESLFGRFFSYCQSLPSISLQTSMWTIKTRTQIRDLTAMDGSVSRGATLVVTVTELKDEDALTSTTFTSASAAQTPESTFVESVTAPTTEPEPEPEPSSSKAWIAGPVVGCVIVVALLLGGFWVLRRRNKRRERMPTAADNTDDAKGKYEKAELHAKDIPRAIPMELEGSYPTPVPEMGANEVPAQEMPVPKKDKRMVAEMAEKHP